MLADVSAARLPKSSKGNRMRRRTSQAERQYLEDIYAKIKRPDSDTRKNIAEQLQWPEKSVRIWFQNMRQKEATRVKTGLILAKPTALQSCNEDSFLLTSSFELPMASSFQQTELLSSAPNQQTDKVHSTFLQENHITPLAMSSINLDSTTKYTSHPLNLMHHPSTWFPNSALAEQSQQRMLIDPLSMSTLLDDIPFEMPLSPSLSSRLNECESLHLSHMPPLQNILQLSSRLQDDTNTTMDQQPIIKRGLSNLSNVNLSVTESLLASSMQLSDTEPSICDISTSSQQQNPQYDRKDCYQQQRRFVQQDLSHALGGRMRAQTFSFFDHHSNINATGGCLGIIDGAQPSTTQTVCLDGINFDQDITLETLTTPSTIGQNLWDNSQSLLGYSNQDISVPSQRARASSSSTILSIYQLQSISDSVKIMSDELGRNLAQPFGLDQLSNLSTSCQVQQMGSESLLSSSFSSIDSMQSIYTPSYILTSEVDTPSTTHIQHYQNLNQLQQLHQYVGNSPDILSPLSPGLEYQSGQLDGSDHSKAYDFDLQAQLSLISIPPVTSTVYPLQTLDLVSNSDSDYIMTGIQYPVRKQLKVAISMEAMLQQQPINSFPTWPSPITPVSMSYSTSEEIAAIPFLSTAILIDQQHRQNSLLTSSALAKATTVPLFEFKASHLPLVTHVPSNTTSQPQQFFCDQFQRRYSTINPPSTTAACKDSNNNNSNDNDRTRRASAPFINFPYRLGHYNYIPSGI